MQVKRCKNHIKSLLLKKGNKLADDAMCGETNELLPYKILEGLFFEELNKETIMF